MAAYPAIAQAILEPLDTSPPIHDWFSRAGTFSELGHNGSTSEATTGTLAELAVASDLAGFGDYVQGRAERVSAVATRQFEELAKEVSFGLTASELKAFRRAIEIRQQTATRALVDDSLYRSLFGIQFPPELWPAQAEAVRGGLLDEATDSWGLAAPTGTGKTFLARMLILNTLREHPGTKVLYIVPNRALVYELTGKLVELFSPLGYVVAAVTPQLIALEEEEASRVLEASVLVLTPEKADMLLRLGDTVFHELSLVIIDEAHHLESSTRGILLEMYLWRLKLLLKGKARFVFLSAVAPNIGDIAGWMGARPGSVVVKTRPTRMRAGVYRIQGRGRTGKGVIEYTDGNSLTAVDSEIEKTDRLQLIQLAYVLGVAGPVLVVVNGKKTCERLASLRAEWIQKRGQPVPLREADEDLLGRLDSRLQREMYDEVPMRDLVAHRVAYHHAGLPPRVRASLEDTIRETQIGFVFATTTLAEGVNFPFSTVIVQSMATREVDYTPGRPARYNPMTPRVFWNIAGRAGRPGFDKEGQVILFEPSLGLDRTQFVIGDYLNAELNSSTPVTSALSEALKQIASAIESNDVSPADLARPILDPDIPKRIQGAVNLVRVSLVHARASKLINTPDDIVESTFAARFIDHGAREAALQFFRAQDNVVTEFLTNESVITDKLTAELGLSIQTLVELRDWARSLADWQIRGMERLLFGGVLNLNQVPYVVGPVAKRMSELEGGRLGGIYSDLIARWLSGVPFVAMKGDMSKIKALGRIEDLITLIFSRVQYLLPWGLYAADRFVEAEGKSRGISYGNTILTMAYLADAGVPSLDALQLVQLDLERTDSARLAAAYRRQGGLNLGLDVVGWIATQEFESLRRVIAGRDNRRLDFDFEQKYEELRKSVQRS